jgi:ABC-type multidrug transport system fused ATPase/permease subunit
MIAQSEIVYFVFSELLNAVVSTFITIIILFIIDYRMAIIILCLLPTVFLV